MSDEPVIQEQDEEVKESKEEGVNTPPQEKTKVEDADANAPPAEAENPEATEAAAAETPAPEQALEDNQAGDIPPEDGAPEAEPPAEAPEGEQKEETEQATPAEQEEVTQEGGDAVVKEEGEEKPSEEAPAAAEGETTAEEAGEAATEAAPEQAGAEEEAPSPVRMSEVKTESPVGGKDEELALEEQAADLDSEVQLVVEGDPPMPGTPEKFGSDLGDEELMVEEEEEEEPRYNREELVQQYQAAMQEREQLTQQNRTLQHKLSEYFRKKKADDARQEMEKNTADQEQRYMKYMSNLEELRQQQAAENDNYQEQLREMKERKAEKQERVEEEWTRAVEFKRNVALNAINSRSGRPIPPKDIEMYELHERKKELEVSQVRLEYIKLKNRLKKQETQLKQKEELAEGLHLIDFEQLKIENQTYNEKIEERNEELLKLRKKITNTVQVLTHLKEKLQFVQAENAVKKEQLEEVEREVAHKRDILSRTKQSRDNLRHENTKFQQRCGLLGNRDLLRDFEVSTDEASELEHRLDLLKRTHAELTLSLNGIKKKIELAKENQS